ncbi:MAG: glycosyltransferase [Rubrobacteraceae bacterium]
MREIEVENGVRVDLHLHSYASGTSSNWWVRGLGAGAESRESYTPPEEAYRMAKRAGMDFVTLTDHETIEGAVTLAHHPDFIVGEEVSAKFPEDGAHADVLVYGLDADDHQELQARRGNIYELVDYLREAGLVHVLAHPIYGMPKPVDRKQVEKRLVLFGLWEFINGSRPAGQNRLAREISTNTDAPDLRLLAARHGLSSPAHHRIAGTAGSDDHGGLHGGTTYTVTPIAKNPKDFLEALAAGETRPAGKNGSVDKLVHTGLKLTGSAIKDNSKETPLLKDLTRNVPLLRNFVSFSGSSGDKVLSMVPLLARLGEPAIRASLVGRYEESLSGALRSAGPGFPAMNLVGSLGHLVDSHLYLAPYLVTWGYFGREERKARGLRRELFPERAEGMKVGVFVDDSGREDSIANTYRGLLVGQRPDSPGRFRLVSCGERKDNGVSVLRAVSRVPAPLDSDLELTVPSLLDVFEHITEEGYDTLHVATPGPLGVAALVAGISLSLPVVGAYHTEFGARARTLADDEFVGEVVDVAMRQFYERCSMVLVPSNSTELELRNRGYRVRSFEVLDNNATPMRILESLTKLHARILEAEKEPTRVSQPGGI